jgi:hypothetical protein
MMFYIGFYVRFDMPISNRLYESWKIIIWMDLRSKYKVHYVDHEDTFQLLALLLIIHSFFIHGNDWMFFITNLTFDELIMKIMWSSFIHRFIHFTYENTFHTLINVLMNECHTKISSFYKPMYQMCFQSIILVCEMYELWMNFFSQIMRC